MTQEFLSECNENIVYAFGYLSFNKLYDNHTIGVTQDNSVSLILNFYHMSRLKQSRNIDSLIKNVQTIIKSQCSLSEQDFEILNEALVKLQSLKKKKGRTNEQVLIEVVKIVELLAKFFL